MATVGIVEDDRTQAQLLAAVVESAGHQAITFASALEFRRRLARAGLDLLVLDCMLPDESGVELLRWLRASAFGQLPVLILTMLDEERNVLAAFEAGADDYIVKPASPPILQARIAAQLRRAGLLEDNESVLRLSPYTVDSRSRRISIDDTEIPVTEKEFDLAYCLFRRANLVVGREQILREVWRVPGGVETRSLDTYLSRLRKRLALKGTYGWRLRTIYQHGYRLETVPAGSADTAG